MGTMASSIGSQSSFELIFREYYEGLCYYANMWLKDMDSAEEVVQSTFVKIWEKDAMSNIQGSVKSYLYRAVYNASLNEIKHRKVKDNYINMQSQEEPMNDMQSESQVRELERRIEDAIQKLPEQCGIIFRMSRFRELKYKEIAEILGISIKTVENQMGKALRLMRTNLADYLGALLIIIHTIIEQIQW